MPFHVKYDGSKTTTYEAFGLTAGRANWFLEKLKKAAPYTQADIQPKLQTWAKNAEEYAYFMYFVGTVDGRQIAFNELTANAANKLNKPLKQS
jgi:hypothetical protein